MQSMIMKRKEIEPLNINFSGSGDILYFNGEPRCIYFSHSFRMVFHLS